MTEQRTVGSDSPKVQPLACCSRVEAAARFVVGLFVSCVLFGGAAAGLRQLLDPSQSAVGLFLIVGVSHAATCAVFSAHSVRRILQGRDEPRTGTITCAFAGLKRGSLLSVITVPLVLILLPAFAGAQRRHRPLTDEERCRSNLRQVGLAITAYMNHNGGWTPSIEPKARALAKKAGIPSGCILGFLDEDERWRPSGLGRLYAEGYLSWYRSGSHSHCPATSGKEELWVAALAYDPDDWTVQSNALGGQRAIVGPTDGDGIGELPGDPGVMLTSYVLRPSPERPWGTSGTPSWRIPWHLSIAIVSDLLFFGPPGAVRNHGGDSCNVLFSDGSVRDLDSGLDAARHALAEKEETTDLDEVVKKIFSECFDSLYTVDEDH